MYHNENLGRERNERINKLIRLIRTAEAKNEIINKTTLKHTELGSPATLGRDLALIGDAGERIASEVRGSAAVIRWPSWLRCSAMVLLLGSTLPSLSRTGMVCALLALVLSLTLLRTDIGPRWRVGTLAGLGAAGAVGLSRLLEVFARAGREQSGSAEYCGTILVLVSRLRFLGASPAAVNRGGTTK